FPIASPVHFLYSRYNGMQFQAGPTQREWQLISIGIRAICHPERKRRICALPGERSFASLRMMVTETWHTCQDRAMTSDTYFLDDGRFTALYRNLFAHHLCLFPFPLILIKMRVLRMKFLDIQVFHVGNGIRYAPGNMLIMSNHNTRSAGETCPDDINIACYQV